MTLSQLIKLRTNNGQVIIDFLIEVVQDRYEDFQICHRLQAAQLLNTYGNEDAPNFIDDNPRSNSARRNRSKASRQTKFDTELARVIREDTQDGRSIARFLVDAMVGEFRSFRPHHRMSAARELLDRGFGKSARNERVVRPRIESGAGSEPVEGPDPTEGPNPPAIETNEIMAIPESHESEFRQPNSPTNDTNEITPIPESRESEFRQPAEERTLTPHSSPLTPRNNAPRIYAADDIDDWLDIYDSPLFDFMCECEHPDFDPCLAAIDEDYFESFTDCTDPECEVHGDPPDFDPNDYHY